MHTKKFKRNILPVIEKQWIAMTLPDRPTSRHQRYLITEKGRRLLAGSLEWLYDFDNILVRQWRAAVSCPKPNLQSFRLLSILSKITQYAEQNIFTPKQYVWFGGYPGAATLISDEVRWRRYITESLIETSISKNILILTRVDKPALTKRLFELGCSYSGQILSCTKILGHQPLLLVPGKSWRGFHSGTQGKSDRSRNQKRPHTTRIRHGCVCAAIQSAEGTSGLKFRYPVAGISWTGTTGTVCVKGSLFHHSRLPGIDEEWSEDIVKSNHAAFLSCFHTASIMTSEALSGSSW